MKKHFLSLFLLTFTLQFAAFAQKDFRPGYIVTAQNDTLRGLLNYKGDTKSALGCTFKASETAEEQTFTPEQLPAYGFTGGKIYESLKVQAMTHPYNELTMKFEHNPVQGQPETNFLKILVKGPVSLFYMVDVNGAPHFFLQTKTGEIKELAVYKANIFDPKTGQKYHQKLKVYAGTLFTEFADCPELKSQIEKTELKESQLTELVVKYNTCKAPGTKVLTDAKIKPVISLAALAGMSYSALKIKANGHYLENGEFESKPALTIGAALDITLPIINEKLSLNNAIFYTQRNYTALIKQELASNAYNNYQVAYNFSYVRLENTIRYTVPSAKVAPFLQIGISNSLMLKGEENIVKTRFIENHPSETTPHNILNEIIRKHQLGLAAGAGLKYTLNPKHQLLLQLNYERNSGFTKGVGFSTNSHNFTLMGGYTF